VHQYDRAGGLPRVEIHYGVAESSRQAAEEKRMSQLPMSDKKTVIADSSESDVVVGCISKYKFKDIAAWANSLATSGFRGRRVVIHLDVDAGTIAELQQRGFELYDAAVLHDIANPVLKKPIHGSEISVNRFYYIWHFLSQHRPDASPPRYLCMTDVRDVIFQRNPSQWIEKRLGEKRLLVGCESLRFEDEPWGAKTLQDSYGPDVWNVLRRRLIYCAGIIAGEFRTTIDLCLQIYLMSPGDRVHFCDQMALNLLLSSRAYEDITYFASLGEDWACHAGALSTAQAIERAGVELNYPTPQFDGKLVRTFSGETYTIVHQYDCAGWRPQIESLYGVSGAASHAADDKPHWSHRIIQRLKGS